MTLYDSRTTLSAQVVEEVRRTYPEIIFKTLIPRNVRLSEAPSYGVPIGQYSPRSRGGLAYAELTRELMARAEGDKPEGGASAVDVGAEKTSDRAEAAVVVPAGAGTSSAGPSANDDIGPELSAEAPEGIIDG
jgi:hypothetical protein